MSLTKKAKETTPMTIVLRSKTTAAATSKVVDKTSETPKEGETPKNPVVLDATKGKEVDTGNDEQLTLSPEEIAFILQARSDGKKAEAYKKATPQGKGGQVAQPASASVHPQEEAYADILGENAILNEVHAHCLGIVRLEPLQLRAQAKTALAKAKTWALLPGANEKVRDAIASALPLLGKELLKLKKELPVPTSFSADKVAETYKDSEKTPNTGTETNV